MIWALFGASTIASQYVAPAIRAAGGDVSIVVSGSAQHAAEFAASNAIPSHTTRGDDALSDASIDAVYVSSTNEKHFPQAMAAIAAGKHVLCEKPIAMTADDARTMVSAARDAGVVFATNHHMRSAGSHRAIRELVASGRIGRVLSMRIFHAVELPIHLRGWRLTDPAAGGGVIPDLTVHNADIARFILGEDPQTIVAQMGSTGLGEGVEDSAMSVWSMPSGAMVFSHESFTHPHASSGIEVHGTEGSIVARGVLAQDPVGTITLTTKSGDLPVSYDETGPYVSALTAFHTAVATGSKPAATGEDGLKSLLISQAVRTAAETGQAQTLSYGDAA